MKELLAALLIIFTVAATIALFLWLGFTAGITYGVCEFRGGEVVPRTDICIVDGRVVE